MKRRSMDLGLEDVVLLGTAFVFLAIGLGAFLGLTFIVFLVFLSNPLIFLLILAGLVIGIYLIKYISAAGFRW